VAQRRNLTQKRIKQMSPNPTKILTSRQQRILIRKGRIFSTLTKKSLGRRVVLRANHSKALGAPILLKRGNPMVYPLEVWKYKQPQQEWAWKNPSAVPGLIKLQKLKFLNMHRRYALAILNRWMYHRSRKTWVRWLQELKWNQWAWVQRLEHLPAQLLTKTGWFIQPKEAMIQLKAGHVQLNFFPKGKVQVNSFMVQPGDVMSFPSVTYYHQCLSRPAHLWVQQWGTPIKHSKLIYL